MPQYVADGEPSSAEWAGLRQHLSVCPACRAYLDYVRSVETALNTMPRQLPPERLPARIMANVRRDERMRQEAQGSLARHIGWDVIIPAFTLILALLLTVQLVPREAWPVVAQPSGEGLLLSQPVPVDALLRGQSDSRARILFWGMWLALSVILGGLGLAVGLNAWSDQNARRLGALEHQVRDAALKLAHRSWRAP